METAVISQTQTTLHTAYVNKIEDLLFAKELHELRDNIVFNTKTKCNCNRRRLAFISVEPETHKVDAVVVLCKKCFRKQKKQ
ncbi:MAG: hypothetical protein ACOXZ9_03415 [Bacteroidales bacterium]|jgi:hypothetical protein